MTNLVDDVCPECGDPMKGTQRGVYHCINEDCVLEQCRFRRWRGPYDLKYVGPARAFRRFRSWRDE